MHQIVSWPEALNRKLELDWQSFKPVVPQRIGAAQLDITGNTAHLEYMNWAALFEKWSFPMAFPAILTDGQWGEAARQFFAGAQAMLNELYLNDWLQPVIHYGIWPAYAQGQTIIVEREKDGPGEQLYFLRQQLASQTDCLCLADYIKPQDALLPDETDFIGAYTVAISGQLHHRVRAQKPFDSFLMGDISELYVSALADYLHYQVRRFSWGYCDDDDLSNEEVVQDMQTGIRTEWGKDECPDLSEWSKTGYWMGSPPPPGPVDSPLRTWLGGYFFAHPKSRKFTIDAITNEQLLAYAYNKQIDQQTARHQLNGLQISQES